MSDIIKAKTLRAIVGGFGMILPWIVALLVGYFPKSISITWYTNACTPFMIILGCAGVLLMCYHGYDVFDDVLNTAAGIFAIGICLFPCKPPSTYLLDVTGTFLIPNNISNIIHNICAVSFFGILSYNSFFQFTKSNGNIDTRKRIRNIIYRICGIGMIASFLLFLLPDFYIKVWLIETFALFFFGISWITKANIIPFLAADPKIKKK